MELGKLRVAYLILAHAQPQQLVRLVRLLSDDDNAFFIHINQLSPPEVFNEAVSLLSGKKNVWFVDRLRVRWGTISLVEAQFSCLRAAISVGRFDMYVLLSGQDYPLKPAHKIKECLQRFTGKSLIEYWPLPSDVWRDEDGGRKRYLYWHLRFGKRFLPIFGPHKFSAKLVDIAWNFVAARVQITRKFPLGLKPFGGPFWCALSDDAARHAVRFVDEHPEFHVFFRRVKLPDEMYIQTIIMNSVYEHDVVNTCLHYVDWGARPSPSPRVLTLDDCENLAVTDKLFARKFDMDRSPAVLDWIDQTLLLTESEREVASN